MLSRIARAALTASMEDSVVGAVLTLSVMVQSRHLEDRIFGPEKLSISKGLLPGPTVHVNVLGV